MNEKEREGIFMSKMQSVQDNLYGNFSYPNYFEKIIRSAPVMRLYRRKQLGLLEQVYPSGYGNRYEHSLGVMFLMNEFVRIIWEKSLERKDNTLNFERFDKDKTFEFWTDVAMLCGLFHDVGHGPLSHVFEQLFPEEENHEKKKHEDWTIEILSGFYTKEFWNRIEIPAEKIVERMKWTISILKEVYREEGEIPDDEASRWFFFLICRLLSGPFDLDKLDYLLRDRLNLGFGYNTIDFDWLKQCIGYKFDKDNAKESFIFFSEDEKEDQY